MRDYVEIGVGREARRTYDLNQVSLVPTRRTRSSKDVDTSWHIDAYTFDVPFVSQPTDALATPEFVICLLYTSPSPRDRTRSRMPSSA